MRNLHCSGRFLRFLRSICAKTACARRAIVALFVVVATILATFMIMPSASMGASSQNESNQEQTQSQTKSENAEPKTEQDVNTAESKADAKGGASASGENGESKSADLKTIKPNNPQPSNNPDDSNADHAQNVDSEKKQNPAVGDKKDAKKDTKIEESANKLRRQKRELGNTRAATSSVPLPEACKKANKNTFADCYTISYRTNEITNKFNESKLIHYYDEYPHISKPEIKIAGKKSSSKLPEGVWLELTNEKVSKKKKKGIIKTYETAYSWAFFKGSDGEYTSKSTGNVSNSDGFIRFYPSKWPKKDVSDYRTIVKVHYPDNSVKEIIVRASISYNNLIKPQANDLTFNIYNHEAKDGQKEVDDNNNSITIDSTSTDPSADDTYNPITPLFIHSSVKQGIGTINHRMVCNKSGTQDYSLDGINGLTLSGSSSGTSTNKWVQSTHNELKNRPNGSAKNSGNQLYEDDDYREQSRSWITGTPQKPGTYVCKVFALKDAHLLFNKVNGDSYVNLFNSSIGDKGKLQSVFEDPMNAFYKGAREIASKIGDGHEDVNDGQFKGSLSDKKNIDWDVKTIKIIVKSNKKQKLDVKDGDLNLNVYPFKNNDSGSGGASSALADGDTVSVMKGIELKPFIEATSKADSTKQITLKMLCSKGEKPQKTNAGAAGGASNASKTGAAGFEYTKWVDPSSLGFNFPDDKAQNPCKSEEGKQSCTPDESTTKFAARTNASATFMSTEDGYYKCVVYALKPDALTKFNAVTTATPDTLSAAFAGLKADKDYAQSAVYIHVTKDFTLPHTGEWNWNLQLGAVAAVMVSVLAAGFVISQSEACRKLLYERRRC
ncbi:hypothetical protein ACLD5Z_00940 [Gardnerella piotii]|uniref:hypothetical protein n=1 Tax=Gardnerella piotii TaxID=2792977 RepID=UPI0039709A8C